MQDKRRFIVSADWLEKRLGEPGLTIIDASWYLPAQKRDAEAEYDAAHIPGAVFSTTNSSRIPIRSFHIPCPSR